MEPATFIKIIIYFLAGSIHAIYKVMTCGDIIKTEKRTHVKWVVAYKMASDAHVRPYMHGSYMVLNDVPCRGLDSDRDLSVLLGVIFAHLVGAMCVQKTEMKR